MSGFAMPRLKKVGQSLEERRARLSVQASNQARIRENGYAERKAPLAALAVPPLSKAQGCLWLNEEQPSDLDHCCGAKRMPLKPYCEEHQARARRKGSNASAFAHAVAENGVAWSKRHRA